MRIRVIKEFRVAGRLYRPGVYAWTADLADDADELVKQGWLIVFADSGEVVPLQTPEFGQALVLR